MACFAGWKAFKQCDHGHLGFRKGIRDGANVGAPIARFVPLSIEGCGRKMGWGSYPHGREPYVQVPMAGLVHT